MSTSISDIKTQLTTNTRFQRVPVTLDDDDYIDICVSGCKRFYFDTGIETSWETEFSDGVSPTLSRDLNILELEYCLVASEIEFFKMICNYWNTMISYTTNALSISNAYKPFEFIAKTIDNKEKYLVDLFHKMTESSSMSEITEVDSEYIDFEYEG